MDAKFARTTLRRPDRASCSWRRQGSDSPGSKVCTFWLAGNCRRNPCRFLHSKPAASTACVMPLNHSGPKGSFGLEKRPKVLSKRPEEDRNDVSRKQKTCNENTGTRYSHSQSVSKISPCSSSVTANEGSNEKAQHKVCESWIQGNCTYAEKCKFLHAWSHGNGFSMLAQLEGHKKAVTGIALPSGSDNLFSGSSDGTVRGWSCHTGECVGEVNMGVAVGCLINEGPWVFVGITNAVKAWNFQTRVDLTLRVPGGQVYALAEADGLLLAGVHDGSILVWKFNSVTCLFEETASLKGHTGAVVSLTVGVGNKLYSGSMDNTIRVWDLHNLLCLHTLNKHSEVVMSMICWDQYLLSCSLDRTLKVWAATEAGGLEVTYTHNEEHGILALNGMLDAENKPILLCSCNDHSVRLYELPSFVERGRIFAKEEVRTIHAGPGGLFFTGDGTGRVSVWRLLGDSTANV